MRSPPTSLAGHILLAHPLLRDPNFCRSIVFLTAHEAADGAFGFVLNRPIDSDHWPAEGPSYYGGPVETNRFSLVSLTWNENPPGVSCRIFDEDAPHTESSDSELRIFQGYAGWSPGQLEAEIAQGTWVVLLPNRQILQDPLPDGLWRELIRDISPHLDLLAGFPTDPSQN
jgi:putative transcriptional regulator